MPRERKVSELFGVPDPPKTGRERLVAAAIELFYTYGFQAVGLDHIITTAGVTKSTFYKHFESKEDLMVAAVKRRDEWETQAWDRALREVAGDDPRARLLALFDVFDMWFNDPDFKGCQFINTAAEFPNPNDPVHQAAAEHKRKTRDWFRDLAARAGAARPEQFADCYTALMEGVLVLRQVHGRNDAVAAVRPAVQALVDEFIPAHEPGDGSEFTPPRGG